MTQQTYVFRTELVGFDGVRRTITVRDDMTLVDLHYALQSAFGWDDDHLYAFWLDGSFWVSPDAHYMHPYHAVSTSPPGKSACAQLKELGLAPGRRIAYARCIEREGVAPPQYPGAVPEKREESGQATVEFVALMVEEADAA